MKFKCKSAGKKVQEHNVGAVKMFSHSEATHILDNVIEQPEAKNKKDKTPAKKVVYISKNGSKAIFDSIKLTALIFGVDPKSIRDRIEKPIIKRRKEDWLKGGIIEYLKD